MQQSLLAYEHSPHIVGVCSYLPPNISTLNRSNFLLRRRNHYGFGLWKHKELFNNLDRGSRIANILSSFLHFFTFIIIAQILLKPYPYISKTIFRW